MMNVVYTTPDTMFQVVEKDGLYYPQQRYVSCPSYQGGRIVDLALEQDLLSHGWNVHRSAWSYFHLGWDCRGNNKGNKALKTAEAARKFVERCSQKIQEEVA